MTKRKNPAAVTLGRKGGKARGVKLRAGEIPYTGFAAPKPTVCPRCNVEQPTAREARRHCRNLGKSLVGLTIQP